jgi:hypothetical protein
MGNFPTFHLITERDSVFKIPHVKTLETMDDVHSSHTYRNMPPSEYFILGEKKTFDYLHTKLRDASQQLSTFPLTAAVQRPIQLAQITHTVYTFLCVDIRKL